MADRTKRTGTCSPVKNARGEVVCWPPSGGRKTGYPRYRARIRLGDGSQFPYEVPEKYSYSKERAVQCVTADQQSEDATGAQLAKKQSAAAYDAKARGKAAAGEGESYDAWYERYTEYCFDELKQSNAKKRLSTWRKWVPAELRARPMASIQKSEIEDVRDALDAAIGAWEATGGRNSGKKGRAVSGVTAMNAWSAITASFKEATDGKRRDLRILDGKTNPCLGVKPPGDKNSRKGRRKSFLFPKEARALLACEAIPIEWRIVYALALYMYLRPGELRVLLWSDVDEDAAVVHITKAWDYEHNEIKKPKTGNGVRKVPIEMNLLPLLTLMRKGRVATDLVAATMLDHGEDHLAELWRAHLMLAGIKRPALHTTTLTHVQSNFRTCRDSGITWLAISGLDSAKIMLRAGHDLMQTTMGYVKQAEDLTGDLGVPFGPLPASLTGVNPLSGPSLAGQVVGQSAVSARNYCAGGGSRTPDLARMKRPL